MASSASVASSASLPWFIAGISILAAAVMVVIVATRGGNAPATTPAGAPGAAPDISNMTPREQADRLFNRVMEATTGGDTARVAFFGPMAINAYANIAPLDADARLHVGMIQMVLGDNRAALAQADSLEREAPSHLFGPLLNIRAGEAANDAARIARGRRDLLARWDAEMAKNLSEYQQHQPDLQAARTAARGSN